MYTGLDEDYKHAVINHAIEYVRGNTHTKTIENFWSLLKRGIHGTYVAVEPFHLFRYIDEQSFRYNHREEAHDGIRFVTAMAHVTGKRLTYKELTGKTMELDGSLPPTQPESWSGNRSESIHSEGRATGRDAANGGSSRSAGGARRGGRVVAGRESKASCPPNR